MTVSEAIKTGHRILVVGVGASLDVGLALARIVADTHEPCDHPHIIVVDACPVLFKDVVQDNPQLLSLVNTAHLDSLNTEVDIPRKPETPKHYQRNQRQRW